MAFFQKEFNLQAKNLDVFMSIDKINYKRILSEDDELDLPTQNKESPNPKRKSSGIPIPIKFKTVMDVNNNSNSLNKNKNSVSDVWLLAKLFKAERKWMCNHCGNK
ncbi:hypothetical protein TKK_0010270 [Trichogramma kaykai]